MWMEIFRTGTHTDSAGNEKTWTEAHLDQIVAKYDPSVSEAPIVIGHPKENAPAYGWVESLKRDGEILLAKVKSLVPEFVEMVKNGLFKKRSMSLYPDFGLRHVGFLGAAAPAVKGLADVQFKEVEGGGQNAEGRAQIYEFDAGGNDPAKLKGGRNMGMRDLLKSIFTKAIDEIPEDQLKGGEPKTFTEAELKAKEEEATRKGKEQAALEFAEKQKQREKDLKAREDAIKAKESEARTAEIVAFVEGLKQQGKVIPAMEKLGAGITGFLVEISTNSQFMEFKDGEETKKQTPLEFMKSFLSAMPKLIEFGEVATRGTETGDAAEKLGALTKKKMDADKNLSYSEAFNEAQIEFPDLAREIADGLKSGREKK